MAFQKAFTYLLGTGLMMKAFLTGISQLPSGCEKNVQKSAKCKPVIDHFFDLWHIAKS